MFKLALITDVFPLNPTAFNKDHHEQLRLLIHDRYTDRVIPEVGLGLALFSLDHIENSRILPGDGRAHFKITFRLLIFAPQKGQILQGVITGSDQNGLSLSMAFFKDIKIPFSCLREPSRYDEKQGLWSWVFEDHSLPYRVGAPARLRVKEISFADHKHTDPSKAGEELPMAIIGSMAEDSLGPRAWWA